MSLPIDERFDVVLADPPWSFSAHSGGSSRTADSQYPTMSQKQIRALGGPLSGQVAPIAVLWLWCVPSNFPEALGVISAWGFEYKTIGFVWHKLTAKPIADRDMAAAYQKATAESDEHRSSLHTYRAKLHRTHFGMGHYTRGGAELCLLATRGRIPRDAHDVSQVITAPVREHSRKPVEQYARIERLYPGRRYLELFARERRTGWSAWGNEIDKFGRIDG